MNRISLAVLIGLVSCAQGTSSQQCASNGVEPCSPMCAYQNALTEFCDPNAANADPTCMRRCCTEFQNPSDPPPLPSAYCIEFQRLDNCFDPTADVDAGALTDGFAFCAGLDSGLTCGACFNSWVGCWTQGCSYTH